jgi:hypothetical protein
MSYEQKLKKQVVGQNPNGIGIGDGSDHQDE